MKSGKDIITDIITGGIIVGLSVGAAGLMYNFTQKSNLEREALSRKANLEVYAQSQKPIVGTVLAEKYVNRLSPNPERSGFLSYSNETVKLDSTYTLEVKTDSGKLIGLSIINGGGVKKESLEILIHKGTRISFPRGRISAPAPSYLREEFRGETTFGINTQVGTKRADRIEILGPK